MNTDMIPAARKGTWLLLLVPLFLSLTFHADAQLAFTLTSAQGAYLTFPNFVVTADINGNGSVDLIVANYSTIGPPNTLSVLTNNGSGLFGFNATIIIVGQDQAPRSVAAADINGDGWVDLIAPSSGKSPIFYGNTLKVFTNNGSGVFGSNATYTVGTGPRYVVPSDVNSDGKIDLICLNEISGTLSVLTNNGNGVFLLSSSPAVGTAKDITVADVNGDSKPDVVTATSGGLRVLTNDGGGRFVIAITNINAGSSPQCVTSADINSDGWVDLIYGDSFNKTINAFTNNKSGGFNSSGTLTLAAPPVSVTTADLNGDGLMDLICANGKLFVFTNNAHSSFTLALSPDIIGVSTSTTTADVNGDGKLDLLSSGYNPFAISILTSIPILAMSHSGSDVLVSWLTNYSSFTLQSTTNLPSTDWSPVPDAPAIVGNQFCVTNSPASSALFYRLRGN